MSYFAHISVLDQFDAEYQPIILAEIDSLMKRFYFSKVRVKTCLRNFLRACLGMTESEILGLVRWRVCVIK
jgi:hypothetical protein